MGKVEGTKLRTQPSAKPSAMANQKIGSFQTIAKAEEDFSIFVIKNPPLAADSLRLRLGFQAVFQGGQGVCNVLFRMSRGNRTLFCLYRKEVDALLDHAAAHAQVAAKVMMAGQVVPVARLVIHKIDAERRALPGYDSSNSSGAQNGFNSRLNFLPKTINLAIDRAVPLQQPLDGGDSGGYRDGMAIVGSGDKRPFRGIRIGNQLYQLPFSDQRRDGISIGDCFGIDRQIRPHTAHLCISAKRVPKPGFHFIEDQHEAILVSQFSQSLQVAWLRLEDTDILKNWFGDQSCDGIALAHVTNRVQVVEVHNVHQLRMCSRHARAQWDVFVLAGRNSRADDIQR